MKKLQQLLERIFRIDNSQSIKYLSGKNKDKEMEYTVWVGGVEVNDTWLTHDDAMKLCEQYREQGYTDVQLDSRNIRIAVK
jgi:hypothetical protein